MTWSLNSTRVVKAWFRADNWCRAAGVQPSELLLQSNTQLRWPKPLHPSDTAVAASILNCRRCEGREETRKLSDRTLISHLIICYGCSLTPMLVHSSKCCSLRCCTLSGARACHPRCAAAPSCPLSPPTSIITLVTRVQSCISPYP